MKGLRVGVDRTCGWGFGWDGCAEGLRRFYWRDPSGIGSFRKQACDTLLPVLSSGRRAVPGQHRETLGYGNDCVFAVALARLSPHEWRSPLQRNNPARRLTLGVETDSAQ